jgi:hypothetical protein
MIYKIIILTTVFLLFSSCANSTYSSIALLAPAFDTNNSPKPRIRKKPQTIKKERKVYSTCNAQQRESWKFETNKARMYCWSHQYKEFNSSEPNKEYQLYCFGEYSNTPDQYKIELNTLESLTKKGSLIKSCQVADFSFPKDLPEYHKVGILYECNSPESSKQKSLSKKDLLPKEYFSNEKSYKCDNKELTNCCSI